MCRPLEDAIREMAQHNPDATVKNAVDMYDRDRVCPTEPEIFFLGNENGEIILYCSREACMISGVGIKKGNKFWYYREIPTYKVTPVDILQSYQEHLLIHQK